MIMAMLMVVMMTTGLILMNVASCMNEGSWLSEVTDSWWGSW